MYSEGIKQLDNMAPDLNSCSFLTFTSMFFKKICLRGKLYNIYWEKDLIKRMIFFFHYVASKYGGELEFSRAKRI